MKGFRDLDPGEAEQVVSSRRRKREYISDLEAQLYAPLVTGYDAKPSEDAPERERRAPERAVRSVRAERTARPVFYDVAADADNESDFSEPVYQPRRERRVRRYEEPSYYEEEPSYYEGESPYYEEAPYGERSYREDGDAGVSYEEDTYEEDDYDAFYGGEDDGYDEDDGERRYRRRRGRRAVRYIRRAALISAVFLAVIVGILWIASRRSRGGDTQARIGEPTAQQGANDGELEELSGEAAVMWNGESEAEEDAAEEMQTLYLTPSAEKDIFFAGYQTYQTDETEEIVDEEVQSSYGVLIDAETGEIIAQKQADAITSPASMTKILTLLVAVEHLTDLDETVIMTQEIGNLVYSKDLSAVGYKVGDVISVKDLLYGTILPSGADAAMLLAEHVAGSQEAFVALMNEKVEELGLAETAHFSNTVGIYDPDNHCTMRDMAMILKAAVENDLCREVLNTRIYTTGPTSEHPEGIEISNWFLRRIEDKDAHGEVVCAKTGFVDQSGCCAASYQISNDGGHYLCVTGDAWSSWRCIYDHVRIYDLYTE